MNVTESAENYLEAILMITQEKGHCRSINIAETLDVTKPSVSVAVGKLIEADAFEVGVVLKNEGQVAEGVLDGPRTIKLQVGFPAFVIFSGEFLAGISQALVRGQQPD